MTESGSEENIRDRVAASETWRRHLVASAHMFANDGIKTLIFLNGGTFIALPALKGLSKGVDIEMLLPAVMCFMVGLVAAVCAQIVAYFSVSFAVYGHLYGSKGWETVWKMKRDPSRHTDLLPSLNTQNNTTTKFETLSIAFEIIATFLVIISLVVFIIGGYQGLEAFYPAITPTS